MTSEPLSGVGALSFELLRVNDRRLARIGFVLLLRASNTMMRRAAVAALCFGTSVALIPPTVQRSAQSLQAVPRDDAAKPLAALAPAAQLAAALSLATITIGAPEVACATSVEERFD